MGGRDQAEAFGPSNFQITRLEPHARRVDAPHLGIQADYRLRCRGTTEVTQPVYRSNITSASSRIFLSLKGFWNRGCRGFPTFEDFCVNRHPPPQSGPKIAVAAFGTPSANDNRGIRTASEPSLAACQNFGFEHECDNSECPLCPGSTSLPRRKNRVTWSGKGAERHTAPRELQNTRAIPPQGFRLGGTPYWQRRALKGVTNVQHVGLWHKLRNDAKKGK